MAKTSDALVIGLDIGTTSTIGILVALPDRIAGVGFAPDDALVAASGMG